MYILPAKEKKLMYIIEEIDIFSFRARFFSYYLTASPLIRPPSA